LSRDRLPLGADFLLFFSAFFPWQGQRLGSWANLISFYGCRCSMLHQTLIEVLPPLRWRLQRGFVASLRPRNLSVPSYRPTQQGGCTFIVRQLASGSGEGQHTSPLCDHRRMYRSRSGCPINRRGLRGHGLCAPVRSLTQRDQQFRAHSSGSPRAHRVRRQAHPLRSLVMEKLVHIECRLAL
jgi:hypothetical protein